MSKITAYSSLTAPDNADVLAAVDVSDTSMATTGTTKKLGLSALRSWIQGQVYSPLNFGAVGDGVTDDGAAIAAAIAAIPTAGGILDLSGASVSYAITGPITLKSGASVVGTFINNQDVSTGANKTDLVCKSTFAGAAVLADAGALATGFSATVASGTVGGVAGSALFTATGSGFASNAAVRVGATSMPGGFVQDQTYFVIPVGTGTFGLSASSGPGAPIAFSSAGTAVTVIASFGASLPVSIRGVSIDMTNVPGGQAPDGILLMTFRSTIERNFIRGSANSGNGIHLTDKNLGNAVISGSANENQVRKNWIIAMAGNGILVDRTTSTAKLTDGYVDGNLIEMHATALGDAYSSTGVGIDVEPAADWQVTQNHCYRCPNDAIVVNHAFTSFVTGNKVDNFGIAGAASTTYHGIWVNGINGPTTVVGYNQVDTDESHGAASTNYHYYQIDAASALAGTATLIGNSCRKTSNNPNAGGSNALAGSGAGGGSLTLQDVGTTSVATGSATAPSMALSTSGTVNSLRGVLPSSAFFNPAAPTAVTSTTLAMLGLGSTCTYTPVLTGKVRIRITGEANASATTSVQFAGRYGTGTAPANGAAVTGTAFGQGTINIASAAAAAANRPFIAEHVVSGLTLGTPIWVDLAADAPTGTVTAGALTVSIDEIN